MGFSKEFMWGVAAAAYQIEGAYKEDGKGLNIWDVYSRLPGAVKYNENGDVACDHYHRYKEDIAIMKEIGIKYYRFSVNWTRILPNGIGKVNIKGIEFYNNLIDELLSNGIEPIMTMFHWDYPYELYKKGGWLNSESSDWFLEYAKILVDNFSDRVKYIVTINEPQIFIGLGFKYGEHAPFIKVPNKDIILMTHNVLLAHGKAVKYIRENAKTKVKVGFSPIGPCYKPDNETEESIEMAKEKTFDIDEYSYILSVSWWSDPVFFGKYPDKAKKLFGEDMIEPSKEDMEIISQPLDFYGTNIYFFNSKRDYKGNQINSYQGCPKTGTEWEVTPEVLYWSSKFLYERYKLPILITENGYSGNEWVSKDGKVHDPSRIDFIERYLNEFKRAGNEGVELMGYLYWSIMDNFEWALGYDKKFGLVHVDYHTQERTIKDSGYWYKEVIKANGENIG